MLLGLGLGFGVSLESHVQDVISCLSLLIFCGYGFQAPDDLLLPI
jgi:hypothetical protein